MNTCQNCSFENPEESLFCQECGEKLLIKDNKKNSSHPESDEGHIYVWTCDYCNQEFNSKKICDEHEIKCEKNSNKKEIFKNKTESMSIYQKLKENEINDFIFEPKKKKHTSSIVAVIIFIIVVFFVIVILLISYNPTNYSNDNSDSNIESQNQSNNYFSTLELSYLKLDGGEMTGNSYGSINPTYEVTLHNSGSIPALNVVAKINFYKANSKSTTEMPQDTQYIILADYLGPGDSTHINTYIETSYNTSGNFRWYAEIYSAKKY